jgi:hypothetical protein
VDVGLDGVESRWELGEEVMPSLAGLVPICASYPALTCGAILCPPVGAGIISLTHCSV